MPLTPEPQRPAFILIWIGVFTCLVGLLGQNLVGESNNDGISAAQRSSGETVSTPMELEQPFNITVPTEIAPLPGTGTAIDQVQAELEEEVVLVAPETNSSSSVTTISTTPRDRHSLLINSAFSTESNLIIDSTAWFNLSANWLLEEDEEDSATPRARIRLERWRNGMFMVRLWFADHNLEDLRNNPALAKAILAKIGIPEAQEDEDEGGGSADNNWNARRIARFIKARGGIAYLRSLSPAQIRLAYARLLALRQRHMDS
jgi:hypothetical protein